MKLCWLRPLGSEIVGYPHCERIRLYQWKTSIGRGNSNTIVTWPRSISNQHAELELLQGGGAILHDRGTDGSGSRFGSFVGEEHFIEGWREVRHGDIIRLGTLQHGAAFRYEEEDGHPLPPIEAIYPSQRRDVAVTASFRDDMRSAAATGAALNEGSPYAAKLNDEIPAEWIGTDESAPLSPPGTLRAETVAALGEPPKPMYADRKAAIGRARERAANSVRRLNQALAGVRSFSDVEDDLSINKVDKVVVDVSKVVRDIRQEVVDKHGNDTTRACLEEIQQYLAQLLPKIDGLLTRSEQTDMAAEIQGQLTNLRVDVCRTLRDDVRAQLLECRQNQESQPFPPNTGVALPPQKLSRTSVPRHPAQPSFGQQMRQNDSFMRTTTAPVPATPGTREPQSVANKFHNSPPQQRHLPSPSFAPSPARNHGGENKTTKNSSSEAIILEKGEVRHVATQGGASDVAHALRTMPPEPHSIRRHAIDGSGDQARWLRSEVGAIREELRVGRDEAKHKELQAEVRCVRSQLSEILLRQQLGAHEKVNVHLLDTGRRNLANTVGDSSTRRTALLEAVENELRRKSASAAVVPETAVPEAHLPVVIETKNDALMGELQGWRTEAAKRHESLLAAITSSRKKNNNDKVHTERSDEEQSMMTRAHGALEAAHTDTKHGELKAQLASDVTELRCKREGDPELLRSDLLDELRAQGVSNREQLAALRSELKECKPLPRFDDAASIRNLVRDELDRRSYVEKDDEVSCRTELMKLADQMAQLSAQNAHTISLFSRNRMVQDDTSLDDAPTTRRVRKRSARGPEIEEDIRQEQELAASTKGSYQGHVLALRKDVREVASSEATRVSTSSAHNALEELAEKLPAALGRELTPLIEEIRRNVRDASSSTACEMGEMHRQLEDLRDRLVERHRGEERESVLETVKQEIEATRQELHALNGGALEQMLSAMSEDLLRKLERKQKADTVDATKQQLSMTQQEPCEGCASHLLKDAQRNSDQLEEIKEQLAVTQSQLKDVAGELQACRAPSTATMAQSSRAELTSLARDMEAEIARCCERLFAQRAGASSLPQTGWTLEAVEAELRGLRESLQDEERGSRLAKLKRELERIKATRQAESERTTRALEELSAQLDKGVVEAEVRRLRESHEAHAHVARRAIKGLEEQLRSRVAELDEDPLSETELFAIEGTKDTPAPRMGDEAAFMASASRVQGKLGALADSMTTAHCERQHASNMATSLEEQFVRIGQVEAAQRVRQERHEAHAVATVARVKDLEDKCAHLGDALEQVDARRVLAREGAVVEKPTKHTEYPDAPLEKSMQEAVKLKAELEAMKCRCEQAEAAIAAVADRADIAAQAREICALRRRLADLTPQAGPLGEALTKARAEATELQARLGAADRNWGRLLDERDYLQCMLADREAELETLHSHVAELATERCHDKKQRHAILLLRDALLKAGNDNLERATKLLDNRPHDRARHLRNQLEEVKAQGAIERLHEANERANLLTIELARAHARSVPAL